MAKRRLNILDAINFRYLGVCDVDIDLLVSLWNPNCYIYKGSVFPLEYRLLEYRDLGNGHKRRKFTVTISQSDAIELIRRLHLDYYPITASSGHYGHSDPQIHGFFE